jgi:hypothetical protein
MKIRMSVIGATLATLFAANAFASTHATEAAVSMTIEESAPIRATLLPLVTLEATQATSEENPAKMRIADTSPLEVTLLPTVHVSAKEPALATTLLPTIRVTPASTALLESMEVASTEAADNAGDVLPVTDDASPSMTFEQPLGLRTRSMPR